MITHIRMKNFKSWKDSGEVKLAPLTGFFGTNSSGKSSLLQMLLLLKQTTEQKDAEEVIFFGDETSYVNLGDFREVIHGHNVEEKLELGFGYKLSEPLQIRVPHGGNLPTYMSRLSDIDGFTFETCLREVGGNLRVESISYHLNSENFEIMRWQKGKFNYAGQSEDIRIIRSCYKLQVSERHRYSENLEKLFSTFEDQFSNAHYLGPIRAEPQRQYHWNEKLLANVGQSGKNMIDALLVSRANRQKTTFNGEKVLIEDRISEWLKKMDLAYSFSLEPSSNGYNLDYDVRIQKSPTSAAVTLVDMGYGLAQFLPVLVLCYYAPEGSTLILEQPGIHLHPMVQSQIADLLIEVVNERNLQILVESHSEHLLTRLQRRIAEKQIDQNNVALYFCRNNEGVSTIEKLDVDESGDIKNWPENFFGDVMGDMFAMTDKQVENIAEKGTED